jgi:hypothetical protein
MSGISVPKRRAKFHSSYTCMNRSTWQVPPQGASLASPRLSAILVIIRSSYDRPLTFWSGRSYDDRIITRIANNLGEANDAPCGGTCQVDRFAQVWDE